MQQSFYSAASGLKTQQFGVDTWANNLSNINTNAYKGNRAEFSTMYSSYLSAQNSNSSVVSTKGHGSAVAANKTDFSQGATFATSNPYDLAIMKKGFFVVKDNDRTYYTRDGAFIKDADGYLVTNTGKKVYGLDLGKIKGKLLVSSSQDLSPLNTQDTNELKPVKIPSNIEFRPALTHNAKLSINLNSTENLKNVQEANDYISKQYQNNFELIKNKDMGQFFNVKEGDVFSIKVGNADINYTYGTDFKTLGDLQNKLLSDQSNIRLNYEQGSLIINNFSTSVQSLDFSNTTPSLAIALGLPKKQVLDSGKSLSFGRIDQKEIFKINFNALRSSRGNDVNVNKGDYLSIKIDDQEHKITYGKANETIVDNQVLGEEDTFLTIEQFIKNVQNKTGLNVQLKNNRFVFTNSTDESIDIQFNSNNQLFLNSLGISNKKTSLTSSESVSGNTFLVSTYSTSSTVFDETGKKFYINTQYMLKNKASQLIEEKEKWHTSSYLMDGNGLPLSEEKVGVLEFQKTNEPPKFLQYTDDGKLEESEKLEIDFLGKSKISYDLRGVDKNNFTTNSIAQDTRLLDKDIDGNIKGVLENIVVDSEGVIRLRFSNNKEEVYGRIGVVGFVNEQGLQQVGNNEYQVSYSRAPGNTQQKASGEPYLLWNEKGKLETLIASNRLERSNVDLATGLTELIVLQRAYGANSKVVSTSDEMEQEAINLKR